MTKIISALRLYRLPFWLAPLLRQPPRTAARSSSSTETSAVVTAAVNGP